ncbi:MAG: UDP-N-acetylenolpyruvoylglucosamine reductase [Candidatus Kerfeldbacteria bacterium CG08_land_8_20_14_0_20_40_16]|uniref:UDP-N-acetylenolpyruvoylglucosamine reductase n=1 Tax=Candidatus Kerfeldbacteria bacterium CG08_land_8_20_14_0_20_40_16 TaxID=2014244 RepID=A0A2H0YXM1_9BACT|nr:MAG: UDP-N-acetylenolpyruvoylglucosamine reductase [Candidatus Kerfeldbacteria bacterium CG08_land_8_20_14_0_20_40_16]
MDDLAMLNKKLDGRVKSQRPLAPFTTYKIGGPADYYFKAENQADLKNAVLAARELNLPFFILARGSNVLISDSGFRGLIVHNKPRQCTVKGNSIVADSGINLSQLANFAKENSLSGIEFAAGIPGSLGGAIRGNAGAWGKEMKDLVKKVLIISEQGVFKESNQEQCEFKYRDSVFKHNSEIILSAELGLQKGNKDEIAKEIRRIVKEKKKKQEFKLPSAGCVFKNPLVDYSISELIQKKIDPEKRKADGTIPAGYLIEETGLKGKRIGDAMVSDIHANFIVNLGKATAENVIILIGIIKEKVRGQFGIQLQEEIQYVGFDN